MSMLSVLPARLRAGLQSLICLAFCTGLQAQSSNGVLREVYMDIQGGRIADLTGNPRFPNNPSLESIEPIFEAPAEFGDYYGQRMRALFLPPQTGNYTFWIASDDNGELWLSSNEDPARRTRIAQVNSWTSSREWTREANQQSASIRLTNGMRYYLEALSKEGAGGDNLAVRVRLPNGTIEEPIPNNRLLVYGLGPPLITRHPTNITVVEGGAATFDVAVDHMIGARFQWQRNNTGIAGATNPVLTLNKLTLADNGGLFRCAITNAYGSTNTTNALLRVLADTTPPTLVTAGSLGDPQVMFVVFSEDVEATSATRTSNYTLSGGGTVLRVAFGADNRTLILTTTPMDPAQSHVLTVNNVRDLATTPNTIAANSQQSFALTSRPLDVSFQSLPREPIGPSSRRHGVVISEVMYHPTNRIDGRNLEYIELYNAQPWFQELGGWRISGAVDFTFPSNVVLQSRAFLIVAAQPADFRAVYSFTNVHGPFSNSNGLQNSSGTLRLRNRSDAVVFEMGFTGDPPYPVGADGGGHSMVLLRPSYGERDPRAWGQSDLVGGNPGLPDVAAANPLRTIVINEILSHTDLPNLDYIELHNRGTQAVNVGLCFLTDDASTNKFQIPASTQISAGGFLAFNETQLGFALSSGGETVLLKSPQNNRVLDAVRFSAQENGVPWGRSPDGAAQFSQLIDPTPGTANAARKPRSVIINEIMFDPLSGEQDDEYVELHNPTSFAVDLGGWRLRDGVSFTFPKDITLQPGGYLVVARNALQLRSHHAHLTPANTLGDFGGSLANGGERIELTMPDEVASTNAAGIWVTNRIHIPVDEVTYGVGGRWGRWTGGGGSSLELRDVRADGRLAPNWADSDESLRGQWVTVEATGTADHGWADATQLHVTLYGAGEALIDNIEVISDGGANRVANGTFESGTSGWVFQGNHNRSGWETEAGFASTRSLHIRADGRGDSGANRLRTQLTSPISPGATVTLRARARWLKGNPNLLLRLRGNWHEAPGVLVNTRAFGTPGAPNSRGTPNAGPAITDVRHDPPVPAANRPVLVTARVHDPDGLAYLALHYRIDPSTTYRTVAMTNNGAGLFSTSIPGQAGGTAAAFHIQALDNYPTPGASTFPNDAPEREAVVRWGDLSNPGTLPTFRMWISQTNVARWSNEEKMSNRPKDVTFVYGTNRVVYNAGAWFHGSPYHSPGNNSPVGNSCDYDMGFPEDDRLLGETDINLFRPGNGGGDGSGQAEIHGYWFGEQFGVPFLYHRPVFVIVNGQRRDTIFHDAQQPNGDFLEQWYPDDSDGDLHKIQLGFEFGDQASGANEAGYGVVGANFGRYITSGGVLKQARYRATLPLRSASISQQNDYTNLFSLINTVLTPAPINTEAYTATLSASVDVEQWYKVHVTQHLYNNPDSFSYGGGQNAFTYKPERDTWKFFLWDIDFAFGGDPNDGNLFGIGGADHGPRNDHAPFARIYWQALIEAANGFMTAARSTPILYARYNGMVAAGASVGDPSGITNFIAVRRSVVLNQIAANGSPFAVTSNGGNDFTTNRNLVTLTGTAPLEVRHLLVNGVPYPITWTSLAGWSMRIPLTAGLNTLLITGVNSKGAVVSGVNRTIRITYTGSDERPEDRIAITEIMYNPSVGNAGFVEIHNTSLANAFDLSGWRFEGIGFVFPAGTVLEPGSYLVVARDRTVFATIYGALIPVAGEFPGQLDNGGETLRLVKPGATPTEDRVIDQVTYDDDAPWAASADGGGSSLQLIDAAQDNNRVANWRALEPNPSLPPQNLIAMNRTWRYNGTDDLTQLNWTGPLYNDSAWMTGPALLYVESDPLPAAKNTALTLGRNTYYFRTRFTHAGSPAGASLVLQTVIDDGVLLHLNGQPLFPLGLDTNNLGYGTLANRTVGNATLEGPFLLPGSALLEGENVLAAEVHQSSAGSSDIVFGMTLDTSYTSVTQSTPGAPNSVRSTLPPFPLVWLNEIMPTNFFIGSAGITDRFGERDPWVEIYNGGTQDLPLTGWFLSNTHSNLAQWSFPAGTLLRAKQFLIVWLDAQPEQSSPTELHAGLKPTPGIGSLLLSRGTSAQSIVDHLNYRIPVIGHSYGSYPEAQVSGRRTFSIVTPAATNNPTSAPVTVFINEWMADNMRTLDDPLDDRFEDWFELYNPGSEPVDLTGYFLSDTLTDVRHWEIPEGTRIPAKGHLLVWADSSPGQNTPPQDDLHAGFSLARTGEAIGLFAPDGRMVDGVSFGAQTTDVSQGRFPDGSPTVVPMTNATPRRANRLSEANRAPILAGIGNRRFDEGQLLTIDCVASDPDEATQQLTYSLDPGFPPGAAVQPVSGRFTWTPTEAQGPGSYDITLRVTDNGSPELSDSETITLTVLEVNNPPSLGALLSRTVNEGVLLQVTNTVTDSDGGSGVFAFSLDPGAPEGMTIHPSTGRLAWTPTEAQGPGTYGVTIRVTDDGEPPLTDIESLTVFVAEVNSAPTLTLPATRTGYVGMELAFVAVAVDSDLPLQGLLYSLGMDAPPAASVDAATGQVRWTPAAQDVGNHDIPIRAQDTGSPQLDDTRIITVVVLEPLSVVVTLDEKDGLLLRVTSIPGRRYQVEHRPDLGTGQWQPFDGPVTAVGGSLTMAVGSPGGDAGFYRVVLLD